MRCWECGWTWPAGARTERCRDGRIVKRSSPMAIVQKSGMQFAPLGDFIDAGKLRYRPFLSVRDPGLSVPNSVAHPVLAGVRFIQATIANTSAAALPAGRLPDAGTAARGSDTIANRIGRPAARAQSSGGADLLRHVRVFGIR